MEVFIVYIGLSCDFNMEVEICSYEEMCKFQVNNSPVKPEIRQKILDRRSFFANEKTPETAVVRDLKNLFRFNKCVQ